MNFQPAAFHGQTIADALLSLDAARLAKMFLSGTHRNRNPADTLSDLAGDLGAFGITRVARLTGLDRLGVEVFAAVRPNHRGLSMTQGKGATRDAARLSAIMEAVESHYGEYCRTNLTYASIDEIVRDFSASRTVVPASPFKRQQPILWTTAIDLISGEWFAVPFDLVHTNFLATTREDRIPGVVSTNGLASGGNLIEALIHGICEVIERCATLKFDLASSAPRLINPSAIDDEDLQALFRRIEGAECRLSLWDTTLEDGPPCAIACISDLRTDQTPPGYGAGCHLSGHVAIARAVHEAAQARMTRISGGRDDLEHTFYGRSEAIRARFLTRMSDVEAQRPHPGYTIRDHASDCLVQDLRWTLDWIGRTHPGPVLAVDLADDARFRVIRTVIPALDPLSTVAAQ